MKFMFKLCWQNDKKTSKRSDLAVKRQGYFSGAGQKNIKFFCRGALNYSKNVLQLVWWLFLPFEPGRFGENRPARAARTARPERPVTGDGPSENRRCLALAARFLGLVKEFS
jgi:hypothetical protein